MTAISSVCPGCGLPANRLASAPASPTLATDLPASSATGSAPAELNASWFCWQSYREVLRRDYHDVDRWPLSGLTRAAYGAQHPGLPGRDALKSVGLHLLSLHFIYERGCDPARLQRVRQAAEDRLIEGFVWLDRPADLGDASALRVDSLLVSLDPAGHRAAVHAWAASVWERWSPHHTTIARWADWLIAASPPHFIADLAS